MKSNFDSEKLYTELSRLLDLYKPNELFWIFRNITYDYIKYFSEENKGIIYDGSYDRDVIHQATDFQRKISTYSDLMNQSISSHRLFDENYLKQYEYAGPYLQVIDSLKEKIRDLEKEISYLKYGDSHE